nr:UbiA family prenyltransferase [Methylotenera sp.]
AFGFGIPMAFAAIMDYIAPIAWLLLVANIFWAVAYDTEYAMVDREDDVKIGIKSSALTFGRFDVIAVMACYALALLLLVIAGRWLLMSYAYNTGLAIASGIAIYHYTLIKNREKANCFKAFLGNSWIGFAVFGGLAGEYLMRYLG